MDTGQWTNVLARRSSTQRTTLDSAPDRLCALEMMGVYVLLARSDLFQGASQQVGAVSNRNPSWDRSVQLWRLGGAEFLAQDLDWHRASRVRAEGRH